MALNCLLVRMKVCVETLSETAYLLGTLISFLLSIGGINKRKQALLGPELDKKRKREKEIVPRTR